MTTIGHNSDRMDLNPLDEIGKAEDVAGFLAAITDQFGFHGGGDDLGKRDWSGFSTILDDLRKRLSAASDVVSESVGEPFTAGYREGLSKADAEYRRGYREGMVRGRERMASDPTATPANALADAALDSVTDGEILQDIQALERAGKTGRREGSGDGTR